MLFPRMFVDGWIVLAACILLHCCSFQMCWYPSRLRRLRSFFLKSFLSEYRFEFEPWSERFALFCAHLLLDSFSSTGCCSLV